MTKLVAVKDDGNSHGGGNLIPANPQTVFVEKIPVIEHGDPAAPDALCPPLGGPHCAPGTANGSGSVFVYGNPIHRHDDDRVCGAKTIVTKQTSVYAGD
jgi:uncharacterized Zn-binding protein involved in type VI secretion